VFSIERQQQNDNDNNDVLLRKQQTTTLAKVGQAAEVALGGEERTVFVDGWACSTVGRRLERKQYEVNPATAGTRIEGSGEERGSFACNSRPNNPSGKE
jgi:hypothetical protein